MGLFKSILIWDHPIAPSLQDFQFDMSLDAAQHNYSSFESFERSVEKVISSDLDSIIAYGTEFKPPEICSIDPRQKHFVNSGKVGSPKVLIPMALIYRKI
jgi:hypothetical protein